VKLGLIISNDWELYGDGSGDYFEIQHKPLQVLSGAVHERGAKLTLMAEVGQQFAHQKLAERTTWAREIVDAWEAILREALMAGDDIQLHLHPQWLDAKHEDGTWRLNYAKWAISSLPPEEMESILRKGKAYLEGLLKPMNADYECIAFRAGAYCIQPSVTVSENLRKLDILCDTSVVPGMYNPPFVDFRGSYSTVVPWRGDSREIKYKAQDENGLLEIPVCSYTGMDIPILRRYVSRDLSDLVCYGIRMANEDRQWLRQRQAVMKERYPLANRPFEEIRITNRPVNEKLKWIFAKALGARRMFALDYDQLPSKIFVRCLQKIYESQALRKMRSTDLVMPLMIIGHVKNMHNCENIKRILDGIDRSLKERTVYWTLRDAVKYWSKQVKAGALITT
jgi:hypothetical protein